MVKNKLSISISFILEIKVAKSIQDRAGARIEGGY